MAFVVSCMCLGSDLITYVCNDGNSDQYLPPIMENKNSTGSIELNTIKIAYSMRTQDALASLRRKQEKTLQYSHPRSSNASPKHTSPPMQQPLDSAFNDGNLKYGQSQTLNKAIFNRMRIHIYRREKRPKWLDLPNYEEAPLTGKEARAEPEKQIIKHRKNKTSLNSRKQAKAHLPAKLKTTSYEDTGVEALCQKTGGSTQQEGMVDWQKMNSFVCSLLGNAKMDEQSYSRYVADNNNEEVKTLRRKSKKISYSLNPFVKSPFGLKKLFARPRLMPPVKLNTAEWPQIDREGFEAWQNSDLTGSHRTGIVEYTKQCMNPGDMEGSEQAQNTIFSSKERLRFLIRDKK